MNHFNTTTARQQAASGLLAAVMTLTMLFSVNQLAQPSADSAQLMAAKAAAAQVAGKS